MKSIYFQHSNIISPLGFDTSSNFQSLLAGQSGIKETVVVPRTGSTYISQIDNNALEQHCLDQKINVDGSRILKLAIAALKPVIAQKSISKNSVFILSSTKGNVAALEQQDIKQAYLTTLAQEINTYFSFKTEPIVISNACVSGLMAISIAKRYLQMGLFDDAYLLAIDEVSPFVLSGFQSFQAVSAFPCKPYDKNRSGVSLGEAAAAAYISAEKLESSILIGGDANINDANHISGPSRTGEGLYLSISKALTEAKLVPENIDFISAHGTATLYNDEMEAIALNRLDLSHVPLHSLKGYYGHTLGASGLLESVITVESLRQNQYIASLGFDELGTSKPIAIIKESVQKPMHIALKTASGFGGCNSAVVFVKPNTQ